jgi:hypothetical protein
MVDPETGEKKVVYSEHQTPTFDSADNGDADM